MIFLGVNLDIAVIKMKIKAVFFQYKCSEVLTSTAREIVWRYHAINLNLSLRVPLQQFLLVVKHSYRLCQPIYK